MKGIVGGILYHLWIPCLHVELQKGEIVQDFTYLGSNIMRDGEVQDEVKLHFSKAARAFGFLHKLIFRNPHLLVATKWNVYGTAVFCLIMELNPGQSRQEIRDY